MATARFCTGCGAPLPPGTAFCSYCGTAAPTTAGAPIPSAVPVAPVSPGFPPPVGPAYGSPAPPPRRRSRLLIAIVIVVVIVVVVAAVAYVFVSESHPPVQVVNIFIYSPHNVCGLNANPIGFPGFNVSTSQNTTIDFGMPNYNTTACTIHHASTNTTGFVVYNPQVPLRIPGSSTVSMNITFKSPSSRFTGNLNVILS